jgi:dephospho-CoA kinase
MSPSQRTPIVGLTGAVAAGKSEALSAFGRLGAATLSADAVVHELLETERVRDLLASRWGSEVLADGSIDRAKVGERVFSDPAELAWLEATLHPLVGERTAAWRAALPPETPLAVFEVPLLFETGMEEMFDATVVVVASEPTRVERAGARGTADLDGRTARQLTQEEKAARATYVVRNEGTIADLERELAAVAADIRAAFAGGLV